MTAASRVWGLLALLYAVFFVWYTPLRGPLTPEEIDGYLAVLRERGAAPERIAVFERFMRTDTGDDFAMLNAIDLHETPAGPGVEPGETSEEVLRRYTRPFMARAVRSAAHPVFLGTAAAPALDVWGIEGADDWTSGGLVRYRSRRDLMEQAVAVGPSGIHDLKIAAMAKTIAYPLDPWFHLGDPRLLLGLAFAVIGLGMQVLSLRRAASAR